ncbi:MAG: hypothetical protein AAF389_14770 [Gemmatimonadota bacterium]
MSETTLGPFFDHLIDPPNVPHTFTMSPASWEAMKRIIERTGSRVESAHTIAGVRVVVNDLVPYGRVVVLDQDGRVLSVESCELPDE